MTTCETKIDLSWSRKFIISKTTITPGIAINTNSNPPDQPSPAIETTRAILKINNAKLFVKGVTLSMNNSIKFLENIKQELKRTISSNKYRSEIKTQSKNNDLDYLIDPTC